MRFNHKKAGWLRRIIVVSGMFIAAPAWASCPAVVDTTVIAATPGLTLTITVDKSGAKPGDVLLYILGFCNASDAAISDLQIDGATPTSTDFVSASCGELPPDIACIVSAQPAPGDGGILTWMLTGALPPGASGTVNFKVSVR